MSRIGKQPIALPANTTVSKSDVGFTVEGPKGRLTVPAMEGVSTEAIDNVATVSIDDIQFRPAFGLQRALLQSAVTGVSTGWKKDLELHGVGMRAALTGTDLTLNLGFSHPVIVAAPEGITFGVVKNVISVSGIDKQLVGETAAQIRKWREPEPYKGKGIRYSTEVVRRKAGKTGKTGK
jgi:large subunit ribosomal protein L6